MAQVFFILSLCLALLIPPLPCEANDTSHFLLPHERQDPLKLEPFLQRYAPALKVLYDKIQAAKMEADSDALMTLKDRFDHWRKVPGQWDRLAALLKEEIKGDIIELWPGQTSKRMIGAILFYPQEFVISSYRGYSAGLPGVMECLALAATFGNPVALHQVGAWYSSLAESARPYPYSGETHKIELRRKLFDNDKTKELIRRARACFKEAARYNKIAKYYAVNDYYKELGIKLTFKEYKRFLKEINLPQAYMDLASIEYTRARDISFFEDDPDARKYHLKALNYYRKAAYLGDDFANWRALHYLRNDFEGESSPTDIITTARASNSVGLSWLADHLLDSAKEEVSHGNLAEAEQLYREARALCIEAGRHGDHEYYCKSNCYINFKGITTDELRAEALFWHQQADRPGRAISSYSLGRVKSRHAPTYKEELVFLKKAAFQLKDRRAYEFLIGRWDIERYKLYMREMFSSPQEIIAARNQMLQSRLQIVRLMGDVLEK